MQLNTGNYQKEMDFLSVNLSFVSTSPPWRSSSFPFMCREVWDQPTPQSHTGCFSGCKWLYHPCAAPPAPHDPAGQKIASSYATLSGDTDSK